MLAPEPRFDPVLLRAASGEPSGPRPPRAGSHAGRLVLVADDDASVRELAATMLRRLGFRVVTAVDCAAAVAVASERGGELALIVLDLLMPWIGGVQVLYELDRHAPRAPVVVTSGLAREEVATRFAGRRVAALLEKPYRYEDFAAVVLGALRTVR